MLSYLDRLGRNLLVPLLLRLALAIVFIYHSMGKLGPDQKWGTNWEHMGLDLPGPVQALVAWGEFLGGVALAIGFLSRLAALGLIVIMAGAVAKVHAAQGFSLQEHGYEYNFVLIVMCACVVLLGSGILGLDHWLKPKKRAA